MSSQEEREESPREKTLSKIAADSDNLSDPVKSNKNLRAGDLKDSDHISLRTLLFKYADSITGAPPLT